MSVHFHLNFNYAKVERKLMRFRKNSNPSFPDNLREELDEKFSITQNDCHHMKLYPCVNCVSSKYKRITQDRYEKYCPSIEKNILTKGACNKRYNTEIEMAMLNMKHAEKNYRQDKTNELKLIESR